MEVSHLHSINGKAIAARKGLSLAPSDGERVRVRGNFDCILMASNNSVGPRPVPPSKLGLGSFRYFMVGFQAHSTDRDLK
jgi:hypothetical protein